MLFTHSTDQKREYEGQYCNVIQTQRQRNAVTGSLFCSNERYGRKQILFLTDGWLDRRMVGAHTPR